MGRTLKEYVQSLKPPGYLTCGEYCKKYGVTGNSLSRRAHQGHIGFVRIKTWYFYKDEPMPWNKTTKPTIADVIELENRIKRLETENEELKLIIGRYVEDEHRRKRAVS